MAQRRKPRAAARSRLIPILAGLVALGALLGVAGFAFAATQEQRDSFCASCHTQPESTYYQRSLATPVDLASAHTPKEVRCIDCHSGPGITGRVSAELLGAHNALAWYTGTAVQPAKLTRAIADANCMKCHQEVTAARNMQNHWHYFLSQWQAQDPSAAGCVNCHAGHVTGASAQDQYVGRASAEAVCGACHQVLRGGEG